MDVANFLCKVFGKEFTANYDKTRRGPPKSMSVELCNLESWLQSFLKTKADYEKEEMLKDDREGRIGFRKVNLRIKTQYGTVTMNDARTSVIAQSNIATVCGDCVVCRGKWQYEVQLKSRGSIRIGWLKHGQKCNRDKGVGDVFGSYGFDGNQKRFNSSGNVKMYGDSWHTGDIIGVVIDFNDLVVGYYMNGRNLGELPIDNAMFLYPAITLSKFESIHVNFGREPFRYPIMGYQPLQRPSVSRIFQGDYFCTCMQQLIDTIVTTNPKTMLGEVSVATLSNEVMKIFEIFFTDLIYDSYVISNNIIPLMHTLARGKKENPADYRLMVFLNFLWDFLNTDTLLYSLKMIFERLRLSFREAATTLDYTEQKSSMVMIRDLLEHRQTRLFAIKYIFFDRCDFGYFLHVKPLDDFCMTQEIPDVWWEKKDVWMDKKKRLYEASGKKLLESLNEIEIIQSNIMTLLMLNDDGNKLEPSSRTMFLSELRDFAVIQKFSAHLGLNLDMPPPVALTTFFKLLAIFDNFANGESSVLGNPILSVVAPTEPPLSPRVSIMLEKERQRFHGTPFPEATAIGKLTTGKIHRSPPLSSNLPGLDSSANPGVSNRINHSTRTGLMMIPENPEMPNTSTASVPRASGGTMLLAPTRMSRQSSMPGNIGSTMHMNRPSTSSVASGPANPITTPMSTTSTPRTSLLAQISSSADSLLGSQVLSALNARSLIMPETQGSINPLPAIAENDNITAVRASGPVLTPSRDIMASSVTMRTDSNISSSDPSSIVLGRNSSSGAGNDFVIVALRDILPVRSVPSDVNIMDELIKLPTGRQRGTIDEARSMVEVLDVILFIFLVLAKRQMQKIAEIYIRFDIHESSWNELKSNEKQLLRYSFLKLDQPLQMDPFDIYALNDTPIADFEAKSKWNLFTRKSSISRRLSSDPNKGRENPAECRYSTDHKFAHQLTQEVLIGAVTSHEKILNELSRDKLWVRNVVLTEERVSRLFRLLGTLSQILIYESSKGQLLSFLPDFYMLVLESLVTATFLHLPIVYCLEKELHKVSHPALEKVVQVLVNLHGDGRLVKEDCKDALDRVFATLVNSKYALQALEALPLQSRMKLVLNLIKSYHVKRNVAANWILMRFWHGSGFAFRYDTIPNTPPTVNRWMHLNINFSLDNLTPNPSVVFQQTLLKVLQANDDDAIHFFNNILNNMNWACSEFMNMLQEVKQVAIKREPVIIEPHTLHLVSSCFDFTVAMLRVIEMTVFVTGGVIIRNDAQNNDVLVSRLLQTVMLSLSRLTEEKGCFRIFLDMNLPSAESIKSFPIIAALMGILMATFKKDIDEFRGKKLEKPPVLVDVIYKDCSEQLDSLDSVIHANSDFRLLYNTIYTENDINKEEQRRLLAFLQIIQHYKHTLGDMELPDDDHICIICYSNAKDVYFFPCRHESCLICVKQLLMDSRSCFFCKSHITHVYKFSGELIPDLSDKNEEPKRVEEDAGLDYYR